jgi:methylmalonyl-CoA mutase C-terminal domain/subunit
LNDVIVFGGGIIPPGAREPLYACGIRAIFGPGTPSSEILEFIEHVTRLENCGVGQESDWHWPSSA